MIVPTTVAAPKAPLDVDAKDAAEKAEAIKRGPAVLNHDLRYVSASQITSFDPSQYGGCNRRWYFEKVLGFKSPDTKATSMGREAHAQIENYLKTGEPTLGMLVRSGMHFIPEPGPGLLVEHPFGDADLVLRFEELRKQLALADRSVDASAGDGASIAEAVDCAKAVADLSEKNLVVDGIPFVGYIDVVNRRGSWIDDEGNLNLDPDRTVELLDWKTSSNIEEYGKKATDLKHTAQMVSYAEWARRQWPDTEWYRLSHGYFCTKKRGAEKRSERVHLKVIHTEWDRVATSVREMRDVAKEVEALKVEANFASCKAYRGCPHQERCPDSPVHAGRFNFSKSSTNTITSSLFTVKEGNSMGLFAQMGIQPTTPATPPPAAAPSASLFAKQSSVTPPAPAAAAATAVSASLFAKQVAAPAAPAVASSVVPASVAVVKPLPTPLAVAEEMAKLQALEVAYNPPPVVEAPAPSKSLFGKTTPAPLQGEAADAVHARIAALKAKVHATASAPAENLVLPPDAPVSELAKNADPIPADVLLDMSPEIQAAAEITNAAVQEAAPPVSAEEVAAAPAKRGRKAKAVEDDTAAKRIAEMESELKVLREQADRMMLACSEAEEEAKAAKAALEAVGGTVVSEAAPTLRIFVDTFAELKSTKLLNLDDYIRGVCQNLADNAGAADIRCAPDKSELGFGKWKGALVKFVMMNPPLPGSYIISFLDEVSEIVVKTLQPMCSEFVRSRK